MRYWNEFLAYSQRTGKVIAGSRGPYASTSNELLINIGGGAGIDIRAWVNRREGFVAVALYLYDAGKHDAYRSLEMKRSAVDAALGDQFLQWTPPGVGRPAGYVALTQRFADPSDETDWPNQFAWLLDRISRWDAVFSPIVREL